MTVRRLRHAAAIGGLLLAVVAGALLIEGRLTKPSRLARSAASSPTLKPGDVGFSLATPSGEMWVYGDSWVDGRLVRNAITLNGRYVGSLAGVRAGNWIWPGAPYLLPDGRVAMFGSEVRRTGPGMWGFGRVQGLWIAFRPGAPARATVKRLGISPVWSAAAIGGPDRPLVYGVDASHHAYVGQPDSAGRVRRLRTMGGLVASQYSVVSSPGRRWWLVSQLPFASRRVVAWPLAGRAGPVIGPYRPLTTLPQPGLNRFSYAVTVHPELGGLLTWAVNGRGTGGLAYGLHRIERFWPSSLTSPR